MARPLFYVSRPSTETAVAAPDRNVISDTANAMKELVPVVATSFYLSFINLPGIMENTERILLPTLTLIIVLFARLFGTGGEDEAGQNVSWPERIVHTAISTLAFIGWVYVTGHQIGSLEFDTITIAIVFAFLNIVLPILYKFFLKRLLTP